VVAPRPAADLILPHYSASSEDWSGDGNIATETAMVAQAAVGAMKNEGFGKSRQQLLARISQNIPSPKKNRRGTPQIAYGWAP